MVAFKSYRHSGSIIYSPKNKAFLKQFAEALSKMTQPEKMKLVGNTVRYGGIPYIIVMSDRKKVVLASNTNKARGTIFLMEE